jgi:hypothetical protein
MWILKNSKDLLDNLKSRCFSQVSSIKTFDFLTLYTTLPHDKLKTPGGYINGRNAANLGLLIDVRLKALAS